MKRTGFLGISVKGWVWIGLLLISAFFWIGVINFFIKIFN